MHTNMAIGFMVSIMWSVGFMFIGIGNKKPTDNLNFGHMVGFTVWLYGVMMAFYIGGINGR